MTGYAYVPSNRELTTINWALMLMYGSMASLGLYGLMDKVACIRI